MSKIEVNEVRPQCGTTVTVGGTGETVSVPGNIVKSNALQASDGGNIVNQCGTTVTLGASGDTIALASGASATGFGLSWCSSIKTAAFCAAAGKGYFVNTCGGGVTVTLPATASAGDIIEFKDYKRTWGTACKEITLNTNSLNFQGSASSDVVKYNTDGQAVTIVYADATRGWLPTVDDDSEDKNVYQIQFMVIAGGGGAGYYYGAGGAGGYRTVCSKNYNVVPGTTYPITIGGGGPGAATGPGNGTQGDSSIFDTITSAGGGFGGGGDPLPPAGDGGSGGGNGYVSQNPAGSGNVPDTSGTPSGSQGNDGGDAGPTGSGGGGGGAGTAGQPGPGPNVSGNGGTGGTSTISGTAVERAGGGGGAGPSAGTATGGGGNGVAIPNPGNPGTINTGGGAGGGGGSTVNGGSGIIILRRLTACSTSTSGTVTTCGSDTIHTFTGDGTFVA